jgi:hypothetical protein
VEITEPTGKIIGAYKRNEPSVDDTGTAPVAECNFEVHLRNKCSDSILVRIVFNHRRLRTHILDLHKPVDDAGVGMTIQQN